jgi:hypothetical protein
MSSESPASPQLSESDRQALLEEALKRQEKLAESGLEMARMFVVRGKPEIARRRLEKLIADYPASTVAPDAEQLLAQLS